MAVKPRESSDVESGKTYRLETGCGHLYICINSDEKGITSVFSHMGKSGGCASAQSEAICRLISICLRSNVEVQEVIRQLRNIKCPSPKMSKDGTISSCADALAKVLSLFIGDGKEDKPSLIFEHPCSPELVLPKSDSKRETRGFSGVCPECGEVLAFEEGCSKCHSCGYSKCS